MTKKAKGMREATIRVQLTSLPLRELQGAYLERFLELFADAVNREPRLHGVSTSADLLLRRIYLTAEVDDEGGSPDGALRTVTTAWAKAGRAASEKMHLERVGALVGEALVEVLLDADEDDRQELLGTPEVAERLGVSRERVRQWVGEPGRFPVPAARTRNTWVWRWGDIVDWIALDGRRAPGRPRKQTQVDDDFQLPKLYLPKDATRHPTSHPRKAVAS